MNDEAAQALSRATWRKSSHSQRQNNCVEIATTANWVGIRDSKLSIDGPILTVTTAEWTAFTAGVKDNEFDL